MSLICFFDFFGSSENVRDNVAWKQEIETVREFSTTGKTFDGFVMNK